MKALALALTLGLAACASTPKTILVPCQAPAVERPQFPFDSVSPDADIFTKVRSLLADRRVRQAYEGKLEAANQACRR